MNGSNVIVFILYIWKKGLKPYFNLNSRLNLCHNPGSLISVAHHILWLKLQRVLMLKHFK